MPSFEFTSPEGKKYTVEGPEGATNEQAFQILQAQLQGTSTPTSAGNAAQPQPQNSSLLDKIAAIPGAIKESITGSQRRTDTTDKLPDWATMPELNSFSMQSFKAGLGTLMSGPEETAKIIQAQFPGVKVSQDEKGNYLLQSSIDGKTYAIKPGFTVSDIPRAGGAIAAFTPAGRAATLPGLVAGSAATQAAIEASQAATGGDFNAGDIVAAGALAPVVPIVAGAAKMAAKPVQALLARARGVPNPTAAIDTPAAVRTAATEVPTAPAAVDPAAAAPAAPVEAPAASPGPSTTQRALWRSQDTDFPVEVLSDTRTTPDGRVYQRILHDGKESYVPKDEIISTQKKGVPAAPKQAANDASIGTPAAAEPMPAEDLAATAKKAAEGGIGSENATQELAKQAAPDQKVLDAAKRLGIEDYLQPDHITTNQAYRELAQAAKSIPGSEARAAELQGLEQVGKRADKIIEDIGGTGDYSSLNADVKKVLQSTHDELKGRADDLYKQIREAVPAKSEAPAPNVLQMINARADELGGAKNLSSMEKMILNKLSPRTSSASEVVQGDPLMPGAQVAKTRVVSVTRQPTYALLDDVRRDLTAAKYARQGPFKDSDERLITMLEGALRKDQEAAAQRYGMADTWNMAQKTAGLYKGIQNDLTSLFGKSLDGSIVRDLSGSVKALPAGDVSNFIRLLKAVPESMRQEVTASGLKTAFGQSAKNGTINFRSYADWYEGLLRNKQAYNALMSNLPPAARKQLSDLYRVSKAISLATKERITTGRLKVYTDRLQSESLVEKLYDTARRSAAGGAVGAVVGHIPVVGSAMQIAVASALTKAKTPAIQAVDKLITTPEFIELAKNAGTPGEKAATLRLVHSKPFTRFVRAVGQPRELSNRERWVLQAMQAQNQQQR